MIGHDVVTLLSPPVILEPEREPSAAEARVRGMVGRAPAMRELFRRLDEASTIDVPVLITGETGAGKSLAARALHALGPGAAKPFLVLAPRALAALGREASLAEVLAAALPGRGAGRGEGGTLFVEELGDLPPACQGALLCAIEREAAAARPLWRLICATRLDPGRVAAHPFAAGLCRLRAVVVAVPSLRERSEDLLLLISHFLERSSARHGKRIPGIRPEALGLLLAHRWAGNVRELEHEVERAVLLTPEGLEVEPRALSPDLAPPASAPERSPSLRQRCRELERMMVRQTLERHGWNVSATARELGISRVGLSKKLRVLKLERPQRGTPSLRPRR